MSDISADRYKPLIRSILQRRGFSEAVIDRATQTVLERVEGLVYANGVSRLLSPAALGTWMAGIAKTEATSWRPDDPGGTSVEAPTARSARR